MPRIGKQPPAKPSKTHKEAASSTSSAGTNTLVKPKNDKFVSSGSTAASAAQVLLPDSQLKAVLPEPMKLVLDPELATARIEISVPVSSITPPLSAQAAGQIVSVTLFPPWVETTASLPVTISDKGANPRLEFEVPAGDPAAFRKIPATMMASFRDGQSRSLEIRSPGLVADRTAYERQRLTEDAARLEGDVAFSTQTLKKARAALKDPKDVRAQGRGQLDDARRQLAELSPQLDARRVVLRSEMGDDARLWGLAARFPFAEPGTAEGGAGELAKRLLELHNQRVGLSGRIEDLSTVVGQLSFLTGAAREAATAPMKTELEHLSEELNRVEGDLATTLAALKNQVQESGLLDAVLANAELPLDRVRQSNEPGSFGRMLADQQILQGKVDFLAPQIERDQQGTMEGMKGYCEKLEKDLARFTRLLEAARSGLAALDREPATSLVPTAYGA
ncbi:MAG: hypothetical protein HY901_32595 [Deltaproteobacteria bacterium]|nr:hypothetical protein [Deltaproteobacteria bacterium]